MRIHIKISQEAGLCGRCKNSAVTSLRGEVREIHCGILEKSMDYLISDCNRFEDVRFKSRYAFEDIGWVLETKGTKIGFKPPKNE